jgi:disulfide bond formation protein DsbB
LLGYGYYLQFVEYLDPCPLCITQRLFYYLIGVMAILGLVSARKVRLQRFSTFMMMLGAIGGIVTAGHQVWLQHLPKDQVPECGPGLQYWLENNPWFETLSLLFKGDGNCAEVQWTFLGFSIGEWSLAWFVGFLLLSLFLSVRLARGHRYSD